MILITGATGNLGRKTIDFLAEKGESERIAVLVRDPDKAKDFSERGIEVRQADYFDFDALRDAFAGVKKLAFISSSTIENRTEQHKNVINAAKEAGVAHVVYTSWLNPSPDLHFKPGIDHFETEQFLKASGMPYTLLRHTFYSDLVPMLIGDAVQSGKLFFAAGDGKVCFATRSDMAEALANVLLESGHENKHYDITTNTAYSFSDIAALLGKATSKVIEYIDIPAEAQEKALQEIGLAPGLVGMTMLIATTIKHNELNAPAKDLEKLLKRKPTELDAYLEKVFALQDQH